MKPTETALKNLVIYYEGYRSLPRNEGMYLYYRLIKEASEGTLWAAEGGILEKLKAVHQADSRDIRYFLRETPQERTDYDALKTQDFTIGDFLFRIPARRWVWYRKQKKRSSISPALFTALHRPTSTIWSMY